MNFRENLPRWIFASASKFFTAQLQQNEIPVFLEGQERQTEGILDYIEFRLDGPYLVECTKDEYKVNIEVNLLIVTMIDLQDFHKLYRICGYALECFKAIPIYKYGDGIDDDQSYIGCMIVPRTADQREATRVSHFGRLEPDKPILQSSIEGHYSFYVTG
jgi:hypothetical protein